MRALVVLLALACAPAMAQGLAHPEDPQFFNGNRWQHAGSSPTPPASNSFTNDAHTIDLWRFDGDSPFADETSKWPVSDTGTATTQVAGKILFARQVNSGSVGTSSAVDAATETVAIGAWTLEAWVNATSASTSQWQYAIAMNDASGNDEYMSLGIHNGALFVEWASTSGSFHEVDGVKDLRDSTWHKVAVVKTLDPLGSGKYTFTFWVDGVLDATSTLQTNTGLATGISGEKWVLFRFASSGFTWVGDIDEIRFSDVARAMP